MKYKLLLLFLTFSFFNFAQNAGLTNRTWFIVSTEINNNGTAIPKDHFNFPFAKMNFSNLGLCSFSNELMKDSCEKGFTSHITISEGNSNTYGTITFNDFTLINNISNCQSEDVAMQNFMGICNTFFENAQNETFNYFIQDVYGIDYLKISLENGDNIWLTDFPFNQPLGDDLLETTYSNWKLQATEINNIYNTVPDLANEDFNEIELSIRNFYLDKAYNINTPIESTFVYTGCNMQQYIIGIDKINHQFFIYPRGGTLSDCGNPNVRSFYNNYSSIFYNHLPGPFQYEVNYVGSENRELIITNPIGDKAFYETHILNTEDNLINLTKIYPNPVKDKLYIETPSAIKNITITDTLGKQLLETTNTTIDFATFEKGCYYITISFEKNFKLIKKILH